MTILITGGCGFVGSNLAFSFKQKYQDCNLIVLDNLNTHFKESLYETYSPQEAKKILQKIQFHYTPKHASWLNMAEIELSVMEKQCTKQRMQSIVILRKNLSLWKKRRNNAHATINWKFTVDDARKMFKCDKIK